MRSLEIALRDTKLKITGYKAGSSRPVQAGGSYISMATFAEKLYTSLGGNLGKHPDIASTFGNLPALEKLVEEYAEDSGLLAADSSNGQFTIPKELDGHILNIDKSSKETGGKRFFCTTKAEEIVDPYLSGQYYLDLCGLSPAQGASVARSVVPRYMPRRGLGVHRQYSDDTGQFEEFFNKYSPPEWAVWAKRNPKEYSKLPSKPPKEIIIMLSHIIPKKNEREYLYAWMHTSMVSRSFVYLVLQGLPGVGKNRVKLLFRALHGGRNTADGKKETFGANDSKFNSQMEENTLLWCDELKYGPDMEPRLKEYQNTHISIERKGVDATKSSEVFTSMVISNNYPRDNYILFNSRKFAPLVLGDGPLTDVLAPDEIDLLSRRLDRDSPDFDPKYVAQIAKWILRIGEKYTKKWPNLEYQGPKFWELAHTSMSRWQKIAVVALTEKTRRGTFPGWDETKEAFLWSKVEEGLRRKKEYESRDYRDASTVRAFFETYRDIKGSPVFEVEPLRNSIIQDFWVKPIAGLKETSGDLVADLGEGATAVLMKKDQQGGIRKNKSLEPPIRPSGMSQFQWRKMRSEWEATNGKGLKDVAEESTQQVR